MSISTDEALSLQPRRPAEPLRCAVALALALPSARPGLPKDLSRELMLRLKQRYGAVVGSRLEPETLVDPAAS